MKLDFHTLSEILNETNNGYFDFIPVSVSKSRKKRYGIAYLIEKPLTKNQCNEILSYSNTVIVKHKYEYASEIVHDCVILYSNTIKPVFKED